MKMKQKKSSDIINSNVENTVFSINNTLEWLQTENVIYFYNPVSPIIMNDKIFITWNNHQSSRANAGSAFTTLTQYEHILQSNSFHAIMYDGSIIRSSFEFKKQKLINHSHLWWPSPYNYKVNFDKMNPIDAFEDFITSVDWNNSITMRSPIRIDFDPRKSVLSNTHPAVHMHTQHHECRIKLDNPICFNRFIKYILTNFYPQLSMQYSKLNLLNFTYDSFEDFDYTGTSIVI
ncbi:hypothetical protein D3C76_130640 [compost metagenome]